MKTIIGITGTTSVGKSAVGVELAKLTGGEIISADSMQIYTDMNIGTAKITADEMCGIKHHMLDIVSPNQNYSSYAYQEHASKIINEMTCLPIVVGGTGFYFDSLIYPPEFGNGSAERRKELLSILSEKGLPALQEMLKSLDIESYNAIDLNNSKRVLRAIEIAENGGSIRQGIIRQQSPKYNLKLFVLERSRNSLYEQLDIRVEKMIADGLVDEVKRIISKYGVCDTPAFQAIGYKEIIEYIKGDITLDDSIAKIKLNTRHYAKRQVTYFKKMNVAEYIDVENKSAMDIATYIRNKIQT